jgi:hypothetical protein
VLVRIDDDRVQVRSALLPFSPISIAVDAVVTATVTDQQRQPWRCWGGGG